MAKSPTDYLDPSQKERSSPDGALVASLTNMGENIMAKLVEQTSKLSNQHARHQPHDLAEMMLLCSQVMHVCSRILREIPPAADGASATPAKRKKASSAKESGPNSDNKRAVLGTKPVQFAPLPCTDLRRTGATAVSPTPGDIDSMGMIDEQMLEPFDVLDIPDSDLDIDLWDEFSFSDWEFVDPPQTESTTSVDANSCASAAQDKAGPGTSSIKKDQSSDKNRSRDGKQGKGRKQDQVGPGTSSVKNNPSSGKNRSQGGKQGKGRKLIKALYLNRLVASTTPKMALGEYLRKTDCLVCLCGRGGHAHRHAGNKIFLDSIESQLPVYRSLSRKKKEEFTNALVREFQEDGWRFLRVNGDDMWYEMDYDAIRRKVSQNFRDSSAPSPEEAERRGPRGAKRLRSDAVLGEGEASQPTPPAT